MSQRLRRIIGIITLIRKQRYPSVNRLCDLFEIKKRTLHEDISFIKQELKFDLRYDRLRGGYFDANPAQELPQLDLSPEELFLLKLSCTLLTKTSNSTFELTLDSARQKLEDKQKNEDLLQYIFLRQTTTNKKFSQSLFHNLLEACKEHRLVTITYKTAAGIISKRQIEPRRIIVRNNNWYLVAYCLLRLEPRLFALHRIEEYKISNDKFAERIDFDVGIWLNKAFQIAHGDGTHQVKIKFDSSVAGYLKEKEWHPEQTYTELADGTCLLVLPAENLSEVKRWVLNYGSQAEVIEPELLRKMVGQEVQSMTKRYIMS
ncbi:MAG: WYL domain-containing protein [Candidatus Obscuribacterales bacterium]|nr:WYL domain-containing protein [Candidatus Obscuribacterales bacterium]